MLKMGEKKERKRGRASQGTCSQHLPAAKESAMKCRGL